LGCEAYNALNAFLPADVQANISSPAFGSLYNSQFDNIVCKFASSADGIGSSTLNQ